MRVLGIDTATWRASIGVLIDGAVVAEQSKVADGSHAVSLLPLIDAVLQEAGCPLHTLDAVAVSSGPGSFTGLRIGLSVAKGIAWSAGLRLVGVPTLEALARTVADREGVICALLDARKQELYAACFESGAAGWRRLTPDLLLAPDSLRTALPLPRTVVGDAAVAYGTLLRSVFGPEVAVLPYATHGPRGGVVATLGWERLTAGAADDLPSLEPSYIRPSEAELKSS